MDTSEKNYFVESFNSRGVFNVTFIQKVHCRLHIDSKDLQSIQVCVNLYLDKPEHLELSVQYKQIPTGYRYTADLFYNNHKDINKWLQYFHIVPKKDSKLIFKGENFIERVIRFNHINVGANSHD